MTPRSGRLMSLASASVDPYKYLLYRIIGRLGLDDTSIPQAVVKGLAGGILGWEDDLWFQLMLASEKNTEASLPVTGNQPGSSSTGVHDIASMGQDRYTLEDVYARYVASFPISVWTSNGTHPIRYFQILLLCGQVEMAIQYLWNCGKENELLPSRWVSEVDTMHFAVASVYYGVVRVSPGLLAMDMDIGKSIESL